MFQQRPDRETPCAQEFERRIKEPTAVLFYDCPEDVMKVSRSSSDRLIGTHW